MDLSRMYRIAETGDVNIMRMAEERQRQQQARPQSAWGVSKTLPAQTPGVRFWAGWAQGWGLL